MKTPVLTGISAIALTLTMLTAGQAAIPAAHAVVFQPAVTGEQLAPPWPGPTPPSEAQCFAVGRRCFTPASMEASYNLPALYASGYDGRGQTIAIIDAFGSATIANDLNVYDTAFGLPHMCGEADVTCAPGMPTFTILAPFGSPAPLPQPPNNGTGQESHDLWAGEVTLDVETAHSIAPRANILLVTTPTAETLGVQGFPDFMKAEQYVVEHHLATVISQSFASAEEAFNSTQSLLNLRYAFQEAAANGVTVLGSSGDSGTANNMKEPVKNPALIPYPTVEWPASDPLVTGVGGTYLCTNPVTGLGVDSVDPPTRCRANPGVREVGWIDSGGGFSHVFSRPSYQDTLPAGSTPIPAGSRGVPDIAYQASATTGPLVYITEPGSAPGWYVYGGTSSGSPQWAALVAIADQINGGGLGLINPALYRIGANPARYAADFYDVTTGNNQADPSVPGYPATTGWDPITGLGTPNAATFLPDLVKAVHGQ